MTLLEASRQGINLAQQEWDLGQAIRRQIRRQIRRKKLNLLVDIDDVMILEQLARVSFLYLRSISKL